MKPDHALLTALLLTPLAELHAANKSPFIVQSEVVTHQFAGTIDTLDLRAFSIPAVTMTAVYHGDEAKISAPQETSAK
jgi:hypothetical protein